MQPRFFFLFGRRRRRRRGEDFLTGSNYPPQPKQYPVSADITHERGSRQPIAASEEFIMQMSKGSIGKA